MLLCLFFESKSQTNPPYQYWPTYSHLRVADLDTIVPQVWNPQNHIIHGWDWSMPGFVTPADNGLIAMQRIFRLNQSFSQMNLQFPMNSTASIWVKWKHLEPEKDSIDFAPLIDKINEARNKGLKVVLRLLGHAYSRGNASDSVGQGGAPVWLKDEGVAFLPKDPTRPQDNYNFDPADPIFHARYLNLVQELGKTEIPDLVDGCYIGYASRSNGDEGIGPHGSDPDTVAHVLERLDAWQQAFPGMEHKVFMGGSSDYGFDKGFGIRRGFVEMYMYQLPDDEMGQYVDENQYIYVDESAPIITHGGFHGEENEEYEEAWATAERGFRFGPTTESYPYRYFVSSLRMLQMRCNYVLQSGFLLPKMTPFLALEMGRTVDDTPDVWTYLTTSYLNKWYLYSPSDNNGVAFPSAPVDSGVAVKNFERWLYQRDAPGYETTPTIRVDHPINMWMIAPGKRYDHIAKKGAKMGFDIDDRWFGVADTFAIKVTYFDFTAGQMNLHYNGGTAVQSVNLTGDSALKTATIMVSGMQANSMANNFDFTLEAASGAAEIVVSMVRVVRANEKQVDKVLNLDAPSQISPGETITVSVDYVTNSARDITITLQKDASPWTSYGYSRTSLPVGSGTINLSVDVSTNLPVGTDTFKISATIVPSGKGWADRLDEMTVGGIVADGPILGNMGNRDVHESLKIYPNPLHQGDLVIEMNNTQEVYVLTIIDLTGNVVFQTTDLKGKHVIPAKNFNKAGIYFIKFDQGGKSTYSKLIVR